MDITGTPAGDFPPPHQVMPVSGVYKAFAAERKKPRPLKSNVGRQNSVTLRGRKVISTYLELYLEKIYNKSDIRSVVNTIGKKWEGNNGIAGSCRT